MHFIPTNLGCQFYDFAFLCTTFNRKQESMNENILPKKVLSIV